MSLDKQTFIKLQPRRFIPNDKITSLGSNQYETSFVPKEAVAVYRANGTLDPTPLTFTWDAQTGTVTYTSTTAPNDDIFIDYALYFCTTRYFYVYDNPVDGTGNEKEWEPRLDTNATFSQDVTDQLAGLVSTSSSTFKLLNNDGGLNVYVTKFDNFKNQKAAAYCKIGDQYKNLYNGVITKVTIGDTISLVLKSFNKLFDFDATLNNPRRFQIYTKLDYPNLDPEFEGQPVNYIYGACPSLPETKWDLPSGFSQRLPRIIDSRKLTPMPYLGGGSWACGICDNPFSRTTDENVPTTNLGLESFEGFLKWKYQIPSGYTRYITQSGRPRYYQNGQPTFGPGYDPSQQEEIQNLVIDFVDYNNNYFLTGTPDVTALVIETVDIVQLVSSGLRTEPNYRIRKPASLGYWELRFTPTPSNQYFVTYYRSVVTDEEINNQWYCSLKSKPISQTNFVKRYIESTGQQVDSASFSNAQIQSNTLAMKKVNADEKIDSVLDAVQDIVSINNGILFYDHDIEKYKYRVINQNLSTVDWQLDDSDILEPNIIPKLEYDDSNSSITLRHKNKSPYSKFIAASNLERTSNFSLTFNNEIKSETILHNLEAVDTIIDQKMELLTGYNTYYEFSLASDFYFDINVGDIIRINNLEDKILNNETFIDVIVLSVKKSAETLRLKTYDYKKIP